MQKKCFKCGQVKPYSCFYRHSKMADGHLGKCKECAKVDVSQNRLDKRDYYLDYDRNRPNQEDRSKQSSERTKVKSKEDTLFREKVNSYKKKWIDQNPDKRNAQQLAHNAVKRGELLPSSNCECCGCSDCKIQGHHWYYQSEHALDVIWLCTRCHGKEHRFINSKLRQGKEPYENGKEILQLAT